MIKIDSDCIKNFKCIGYGRYGEVHKIDDKTAYKIYHNNVFDKYSGKEQDNPALFCNRAHYKKLLSKSKKLLYSGGIKDLVYVDKKFKGVSIPYYEGLKLIKEIDRPLKSKIEISKKLVRNSKELIDNYIYPTDFNLRNIILDGDNPQIIDLDDPRTKAYLFRNPLWEAFCINRIGESIQYYLGLRKHHKMPFIIRNNVKRDKAFNCIHYDKILEYINNIEKEKNFIFIDKETDINKLKELVFNNSFEIVYILNNEKSISEYIEIVKKLEKEELKLYDFINLDKIEDYPKIEMVNESYLLDNKELKKIYKKD